MVLKLGWCCNSNFYGSQFVNNFFIRYLAEANSNSSTIAQTWSFVNHFLSTDVNNTTSTTVSNVREARERTRFLPEHDGTISADVAKKGIPPAH